MMAGKLKGDRVKRFIVFSYYRPKRELRRPIYSLVHRTRDSLALCELASLLHDAGYVYGGAFLNVPHSIRGNRIRRNDRESEIMVRPEDILLLATRPPLDDESPLGGRRKIDRSRHSFEEDVFANLHRVLDVCARSGVVLSRQLKLPTGEDKYRSIAFEQFKGAEALRLSGAPVPSEDCTYGYIVWIPPSENHRYSVLAVFGMGGTETLVLSHLLRTTFKRDAHRILRSAKAQLLLIQFKVPHHVPYPILSYGAEGLEARIVAHGHL